jgi:hypothetical protein
MKDSISDFDHLPTEYWISKFTALCFGYVVLENAGLSPQFVIQNLISQPL